MLREGISMDSAEEEKELQKQALQEIKERSDSSSSRTTVTLSAYETTKNAEGSNSDAAKFGDKIQQKIGNNGCLYDISFYLSPIFLETFTMNFFAEWGDKSQISTIFLAAKENAFVLVLMGALSGHLLCNTIAVLGGNLIGKVISTRTGMYI